MTFTAQDIRYTQSKDGCDVYALMLGWPQTSVVTLQSKLVRNAPPAAKVMLLGHAQPIQFEVNNSRQLVVKLPALEPAQRPGDHAFAFKLSGFELERITRGENQRQLSS